MKIILNADVANLGEEGDVVEVKPGYARNFLFPRLLGVLHNRRNIAAMEGRRSAIEKRRQEKRQSALGDKAKIEGAALTIKMPSGANGRLFGSVTPAMVAEELAKIGVDVERKRIEIAGHTIKQVGDFRVKVRLYGDEVATLKLVVAAEEVKKTERAEAARPAATNAGREARGADVAGTADVADTASGSATSDAVDAADGQ